MEDEAIIALFHARSEQAISELIAKHGAAVRGITANILRDPLDVEECANDTYWRIWNRIPPEVPKSLRAFACSIASYRPLPSPGTGQKEGLWNWYRST